MNQINQLFSSLNWQNPSWDLIIIITWAAASFMYAFAGGRGRSLSVLVSVYISQLLVVQSPDLVQQIGDRLPINTLSLQELAIFLGLFVILFWVLSRYAFRSAVDGSDLFSFPVTLIFSVLQIGLLISLIIPDLPDHVTGEFSQFIQVVFLHPYSGLAWLLAPVVFLAVAGRFLSDRNTDL